MCPVFSCCLKYLQPINRFVKHRLFVLVCCSVGFMIFTRLYCLSFSLAKEMDEKRAAAAALGYPHSIVCKDDKQLYEDCATASAPLPIVTETHPPLPTGTQQNMSEDNEGQYDFVPHFQRVSIGGEDNSGVIILNNL